MIMILAVLIVLIFVRSVRKLAIIVEVVIIDRFLEINVLNYLILLLYRNNDILYL